MWSLGPYWTHFYHKEEMLMRISYLHRKENFMKIRSAVLDRGTFICRDFIYNLWDYLFSLCLWNTSLVNNHVLKELQTNIISCRIYAMLVIWDFLCLGIHFRFELELVDFARHMSLILRSVFCIISVYINPRGLPSVSVSKHWLKACISKYYYSFI